MINGLIIEIKHSFLFATLLNRYFYVSLRHIKLYGL